MEVVRKGGGKKKLQGVLPVAAGPLMAQRVG